MTYKPLLRIRDYVVDEVSILADRDFHGPPPTDTAVGISFNALPHATEASSFLIELRIVVAAEDNAASHPYWVSIALVGAFEGEPRAHPLVIPAREIENALALLYGVARGVVGTVTGNGRHGRYTLPSVTFHDAAVTASSAVGDAPEPQDRSAGTKSRKRVLANKNGKTRRENMPTKAARKNKV